MSAPLATRACVREIAITAGRLAVIVQETASPWRCLALPVTEHEANAVLAAVPHARPLRRGSTVRLTAEGSRARAEFDGWGVDAVQGLVRAVENAVAVLVEEEAVREYAVDVESLTTLGAVDHAVVRELLEAQDTVLRQVLHDDEPTGSVPRPQGSPTDRERAVGLLMYAFGLSGSAAVWLLSTAAERSDTTAETMADRILAAGDGVLDDGARARLVGLIVSTVGTDVSPLR